MPRDYAKNSRSSRQQQTSSGPSGIVWLLMGVLVGLIIAGVFYLKNQTPHPAAFAPSEKTNTTNNKPAAQPSTAASSNTQNLQTQFDFYNVLPSQKVVGPSGDEDTSVIDNQNATPTPAAAPANNAATPATTTTTSTPVATPPTPAATSSSTASPAPVSAATPTIVKPKATNNVASDNKAASYVVQIGTYTGFNEVDQLKAQLSLSGFEVNVTPVQKNGKTLQRVWLGPYHSQAEAQTMQKQLQDNQISSKVLKNN